MRLLTLNLWQEQGPWERRLEVLRADLANLAPDILCLQEVRDRGQEVPNQARSLAEALGADWHWTFAPAQSWGGGVEGLAILSRRAWTRREVCPLPSRDTNQRLGLALRFEGNGGAFWVATTHLAYRLGDGLLREAQVLALDAMLAELREGGETAVLCGDFNAVPEADEIRFLQGLTSLEGRRTYWQDAFAALHPGQAGPTWCAANPYTEQLGWFPRDRRLDYVFVSPQTREGRARLQSCDIVCAAPATDGTYPSDHYGLLVDWIP